MATALVRLENGNLSGVKSVGAGVFEHRIDFGPGYRIYFGKDGDALVILLGGGTKRRQRQASRRREAIGRITNSASDGRPEGHVSDTRLQGNDQGTHRT